MSKKKRRTMHTWNSLFILFTSLVRLVRERYCILIFLMNKVKDEKAGTCEFSSVKWHQFRGNNMKKNTRKQTRIIYFSIFLFFIFFCKNKVISSLNEINSVRSRLVKKNKLTCISTHIERRKLEVQNYTMADFSYSNTNSITKANDSNFF